MFFGFGAHCLKIDNELPLCSMPENYWRLTKLPKNVQTGRGKDEHRIGLRDVAVVERFQVLELECIPLPK